MEHEIHHPQEQPSTEGGSPALPRLYLCKGRARRVPFVLCGNVGPPRSWWCSSSASVLSLDQLLLQKKKQVISEIFDLWVIGSIARTDGPADSRDIIGSWWRDIQRRRRVIGDLKRCYKSNYVKRQTVIWMWTKWVKE